MHVLLTGGTGLVGSAILKSLLAPGHRVTGVVRSEESAAKVRDAGATAAVGDLTDADWFAARLAEADAAIHAASPGDASSADLDRAVARAVVAAFGGTGKPYVHTGGAWVHGSGADITEQTPLAPPQLTAWRPEVEAIVLDADVVATVVEPGIVYDGEQGLPGVLTGGPRDDSGALRLIGSGEQHWITVHADDLGDLYVRVLETGAAHGHVIGASGVNPSVREVAEAAAGDAGVVPESDAETRERFGDAMAEALLLDQQASGAKARSFGWTPSRPTLVEQLRG